MLHVQRNVEWDIKFVLKQPIIFLGRWSAGWVTRGDRHCWGKDHCFYILEVFAFVADWLGTKIIQTWKPEAFKQNEENVITMTVDAPPTFSQLSKLFLMAICTSERACQAAELCMDENRTVPFSTLDWQHEEILQSILLLPIASGQMAFMNQECVIIEAFST